jgi:hypothetical protein
MRALCGAILTAGALIGLGLTAIGLGTRYQHFNTLTPSGEEQWVHLRQLDTWMLIIVLALMTCTVLGLGMTIVGLAYHHRRRELEMLHRFGQRRPDAPPAETKPADRISV